MLRYLLILLAVLVSVLAVLFDRLWLWAGAAVLVVGTLGLLGWQLWTAYRDDEGERPASEPTAPSDSLEDPGIVDIRPQNEGGPDRSSGESAARRAEEPGEMSASTPNSSGSATPPPEEQEEAGRADAGSEDERKTSPSEGTDHSVVTTDAPVLSPFLRSLRAAIGAQTVCLLVQEEVALTYRIEALASTDPQARGEGTFDTQAPLLTANMSRQSVSVRSLTGGEVAIEDLRYYEHPPDINHFAVAPVPRPDASSTTFLLADATAESDLGRSQARALLEHYAETAVLLLEADRASPEESDQQGEDARETGPVVPSTEDFSRTEEGSRTDEGASEAPRPRREIIAEEMEAADAASKSLSLVFVHLNRAESIARRGGEAVATAERMLRARLEQLTPDQRVERFGELTYGIFYRGSADIVESWVADLEATMAQEKGELEGGVSVGVAVRGDHHESPEALRADATEALREAYKTGTCTVVA